VADDAFPVPGVASMSTATEWEEYFTSADICGVVSGLVPSLNTTGRQAVMGVGAAMIRGYYKPVTSSTGTAIPSASGSNRIDRLVLRLDRTASTAANWIKPVVIEGTPSSTPSPPAVTQSSSGSWDLPICRWTSASSGALSGLVDERYFLGGQTLLFSSTSRASGLIPASPRRFGIETDTGHALVSDGAAWNEIAYDTGWASLTLNSTYWLQAGFTLDTVVHNGVCFLSGGIQAKKDITGETKIADLASGKPRKSMEFPAYVDGASIVYCVAYASGTRDNQLWLVGNNGAVNNGGFVRMTTSWPSA
jgi:hypothetical protein